MEAWRHRCLVPGACCLVFGAWCLVLGAGAWCLVPGAGAWCLVLVPGAWCWCLVLVYLWSPIFWGFAAGLGLARGMGPRGGTGPGGSWPRSGYLGGSWPRPLQRVLASFGPTWSARYYRSIYSCMRYRLDPDEIPKTYRYTGTGIDTNEIPMPMR